MSLLVVTRCEYRLSNFIIIWKVKSGIFKEGGLNLYILCDIKTHEAHFPLPCNSTNNSARNPSQFHVGISGSFSEGIIVSAAGEPGSNL